MPTMKHRMMDDQSAPKQTPKEVRESEAAYKKQEQAKKQKKKLK